MEKEKMLRTKKRKKKRKRKKTKEGKTERKEKKKMALHPDRNAETRLEGQQLRYNQKDARQVQRLKKKKKKGAWNMDTVELLYQLDLPAFSFVAV